MRRIPFIMALGLLTSAVSANGVETPRLQGLPGKQATARTIVLDADVACSPERAYAMWSTEAGVRSFFAPAADIDGQVGGSYTVMFFPDDDPEGRVHGTAGARLLAAEPGRFIAFEWVVFAGDELRGDNAPPFAPPAERLRNPLPTWVEIAFQPAPAGSHVEFRHFGFGDGALLGESHAWFTRAWGGVIARMEQVCAASSGGSR